MADRNAQSGVWLFLAGLALAGALVLSTAMATDALFRVKTESRTLEVKGFAELEIESDLAQWSGSFASRGPRLQDAHAEIERQRGLVLDFIRERGFGDADIEVSPAHTEALYGRDENGNYTNDIEGWTLRLDVSVTSTKLDAISNLAKDSTNLVREGIAISSSRPEFFYTQLGDLKVEMLGQATADARRRAEELAKNSNASIGALRFARQGVFQITPANSTDVSDYGNNDTSSRQKSIKAVVTIRYAIEP